MEFPCFVHEVQNEIMTELHRVLASFRSAIIIPGFRSALKLLCIQTQTRNTPFPRTTEFMKFLQKHTDALKPPPPQTHTEPGAPESQSITLTQMCSEQGPGLLLCLIPAQ